VLTEKTALPSKIDPENIYERKGDNITTGAIEGGGRRGTPSGGEHPGEKNKLELTSGGSKEGECKTNSREAYTGEGKGEMQTTLKLIPEKKRLMRVVKWGNP